jgi:hypothetical protein
MFLAKIRGNEDLRPLFAWLGSARCGERIMVRTGFAVIAPLQFQQIAKFLL